MVELVQDERRLRMVAEATLDMVTETNSQGRFTWVSPACTSVLGYSAEDLPGMSPQPGIFLVIDDDERAREITSILLERAGFDVLPAGDGAQAIEIFRKHAPEISAIVLDYTMPGLSGPPVFDAIREIDPEVPIILASGYSRERVSSERLACGVTRFLRKPFDADQLLGIVSHALGTRRA